MLSGEEKTRKLAIKQETIWMDESGAGGGLFDLVKTLPPITDQYGMLLGDEETREQHAII